MREIRSEELTARIEDHGAQLRSLRSSDGGPEILWQGSPSSWSRTAPVLFPFIGGLVDDRFTIGGRKFPMGQHGFARDRIFTLVEAGRESLLYRLQSDRETLAFYPWEFTLDIAYRLAGAQLKITYGVLNRSETPMLFSIGAHPGFNCPLDPGLVFDDYALRFSRPETLDRWPKDRSLLTGATEPFLDGEDTIALSAGLFSRGAIILEGPASDTLTLESKSGPTSVTVGFAGFPWLGIWSWPGGAPFVCIEPWYGVDGTIGDPPDLERKRGMQSLAPAQRFECAYTIGINTGKTGSL
jgi:galactose mutarotase-like enzyme